MRRSPVERQPGRRAVLVYMQSRPSVSGTFENQIFSGRSGATFREARETDGLA
ncbi:hypothetical protein [Natrinema gelatinilyticum]|uniref:hypothetical protein n=1 Tax=Natrinema gelatinilyticum TaxID=2961571 RepID=UPI0020C45092|nr:hypothetical protein [Natrinema gelatinilyticum]